MVESVLPGFRAQCFSLTALETSPIPNPGFRIKSWVAHPSGKHAAPAAAHQHAPRLLSPRSIWIKLFHTRPKEANFILNPCPIKQNLHPQVIIYSNTMFSKALKFVSSDNGNANSSSRHGNQANLNEEEEFFEDALEAQLHPDTHPDGGLGCSDLELLERQRGAIMEVVKNLGSNLLRGNFDLLKISLPVKLFEPRSYLEKLTDPWIYSRYLEAAADAGNSHNADPILRMQYVVTYIIAGLHQVFLKWAKPYNPILGETHQASLPDGTTIFLEQISHHPPISAFSMQGKNNKFHFHGTSQPVVGYKSNAIKAAAKGYRRIEFADGTAIEMTFPAFFIKGIVYGGPSGARSEVGGSAEFIDKQNGLKAVLHFQKVDNSTLPSGIGLLHKNNELLSRNDAVSGTIYRTRLHSTMVDDKNSPTNHSSTGIGNEGISSTSRQGIDGQKLERKGSSGSSSSGHHHIFRSKSSIMGGGGGSQSGGSRFGMMFSKNFPNFRRTTSSTGLDGTADSSGTLTGEVQIPVAHCIGNWLAYLDWFREDDAQRAGWGEGERFWTLNEEGTPTWIPDKNPLPSDTRFREDLALLLAGNVPAAQVAKEALEVQQRQDAKLRKASSASYK